LIRRIFRGALPSTKRGRAFQGSDAKASQFSADRFATGPWQQKNEAYISAAKYFELASQVPSGFAPYDARVLGRLAEAYEGQAQMDAQDIPMVSSADRDALVRERDGLRSKSEVSMMHAREIIIGVSPVDPNYRMVVIGMGNIFFAREVGASREEKIGHYRKALLYTKMPRHFFRMTPGLSCIKDSAKSGSRISHNLLKRSGNNSYSVRRLYVKPLR
jgi:hypothetical protein